MRRTALSVGWILVLVFSITLGACGGDEHEDHKDMGPGTGSTK